MSPGCADHPGCDHGLIVSTGGRGAGGVSQGVHHHLLQQSGHEYNRISLIGQGQRNNFLSLKAYQNITKYQIPKIPNTKYKIYQNQIPYNKYLMLNIQFKSNSVFVES